MDFGIISMSGLATTYPIIEQDLSGMLSVEGLKAFPA
jgi:hypothetical protein